MPVGIIFPRRDDSEPRLYSSEPFGRRRILASVMPDLQDIGTQRFCAVLGENRALGLLFRIAGQEHVSIPVMQAQHQRVIVLG